MKKTVNINISSSGFTIDEDAYGMLKLYLSDIQTRLNASEAEEVMSDVEARIADIFKENLSFSTQVVGTDLVRRTMGIIGRAADFGEPQTVNNPTEEASQTVRDSGQASAANDSVRRLYRSRTERIISGVCGGLARYLKVDVTLVRVVAFILLVFGGVSLWVYIIMWIVVPQEPLQLNYFNDGQR